MFNTLNSKLIGNFKHVFKNKINNFFIENIQSNNEEYFISQFYNINRFFGFKRTPERCQIYTIGFNKFKSLPEKLINDENDHFTELNCILNDDKLKESVFNIDQYDYESDYETDVSNNTFIFTFGKYNEETDTPEYATINATYVISGTGEDSEVELDSLEIVEPTHKKFTTQLGLDAFEKINPNTFHYIESTLYDKVFDAIGNYYKNDY